MKRSIICIACFIAAGTGALAQAYEGHGRDPAEFDLSLKNLRVGSVIASLDDGGTGSFNSWCTSFLAPDTAAPVSSYGADDDLNEGQLEYDKWSCMYSPERLSDGNAATAWCEGMLDEGLGETVVAHVDVTKPVRIWAGLGSSEAMFLKNCRPRKIFVSVLKAEGGDATQLGIVYQNITVIAQGEAELKDVNGFQLLALPKHGLKKADGVVTFVAIKILSVYSGTKYKDTCISEVSN